MPPIIPTLRSFRHYALSGLGIVSLLLSAIIAIMSSIFGGGSEPIDPNANIVFTVDDAYTKKKTQSKPIWQNTPAPRGYSPSPCHPDIR